MSDERLSIGWASADITPSRPVNLYGQFHMRVTSKVLDPVTATALVIRGGADGRDSVIFVSADTCVIPGKVLRDLRRALRAGHPAVPAEKVIVSSTHTHTAPALKDEWHPNLPEGAMTADEYAEFFVARVADAIGRAWRDARPGAVSWGFAYTVVGHNRRTVYKEDVSLRAGSPAGKYVDGFGKLYGSTDDAAFSHMEGSEDNTVNALLTWDADDNLTGAVLNIACPAQETEGLGEISADFWHEARAEIRRRHGEKIFVLAQDSAAGGLSPHIMTDKKAESRMLELKGVTRRQEIGKKLADALDEIISWARKDKRSELPLRHEIETVSLPMREITDEERAAIQRELDELTRRNDPAETAATGRCKRALERSEARKTKPDIPFEVHYLRLGDVAFATNSFELFTDYGVQIKARSPATQTFLIQHCGSEEHSGGTYLPTETAQRNKGYSASVYCNIIGHEGGEILVEKTVDGIGRLWK